MLDNIIEKIEPYWQYLLMSTGVIFVIFGVRLLFQKGYVEKQREGIWKPEKDDFLSKESSYYYDKYVRGIRSLLVGLLFIIFGIVSL